MIKTKRLIASSVSDVMQMHFPEKHLSLCHAYAVVGSNLAAIELEKPFRPVAGKAVFDTGTSQLIYMTDKHAFDNPLGGAYHCWIESEGPDQPERELVDLTFGNNRRFAQKCGVTWSGSAPPRFLWGKYSEVALSCDLAHVRPGFGKSRIWVKETVLGSSWLAAHVQQHVASYAFLTAQALKRMTEKSRKWRSADKRVVLGGAVIETEEATLLVLAETEGLSAAAIFETEVSGAASPLKLWEQFVALGHPFFNGLEWLPSLGLA
jgi:hypothetical protein